MIITTRTNPHGYRINIWTNSEPYSSATLICITYEIGLSKKYPGADFYYFITSFDDSNFRIPYIGEETNFRQQLRAAHSVSEFIPEGITDHKQWIEEKMKEAFGDDIQITIEEFGVTLPEPKNQD